MGYSPLKLWIIRALLFVGLLLVACRQSAPPTVAPAYPDTLTRFVEKEIARKKFLAEFQKKDLPPDFSSKIKKYSPVIKKYAKRYGFDWRLIVAQILQESSFREKARSRVGAMGLMQIMPSTAREIHREMDIEYIANSPRENIAAGIYHLYKQMKFFQDADPENRLKLALAAYNCGAARIFDAQDVAVTLGLNPNSWEAVRECLPRLTSRDWRLHLEVWEMGVPNYGYFYGYKETIGYVEQIWKYYRAFKELLLP